MPAKPTQKKVVVAQMDAVWKLSAERERDFLRLVALGQEWDPETLGRPIGDHMVYAGDMTAAHAKELLRELGKPLTREADEAG
jgi:hypothetical protein